MWHAVTVSLIVLSTNPEPANLPFGRLHMHGNDPTPGSPYLQAMGMLYSFDGAYSWSWSLLSMDDNSVISCRTGKQSGISYRFPPYETEALLWTTTLGMPTGLKSAAYLGHGWSVCFEPRLLPAGLGLTVQWQLAESISFALGVDAPFGKPYIAWEISE
jgi:hypothetical protein